MAKPRLWFRKNGTGTWVIIHDDGWKSLDLRFEQKDVAEAALVAFETARAARVDPAKGSSILDVPLARILAWVDAEPDEPRTDRESVAFKTSRHALGNFMARAAGDTVASVASDFAKKGARYIKRRTKERRKNARRKPVLNLTTGELEAPPPAPNIRRSAAETELRAAHSLLREYADTFTLVDVPDYTANYQIAAAGTTFSRDEVARLLWATRGRKSTTSGYLVATTRKERARVAWNKRMRLHWRRIILIIVYTGSSLTCVYNLRWEGDPNGEQSYIDVDKGLLYRLGNDAAPGPMARVPVRLTKRLRAHLTRWRDADRKAGLANVINREGQTRILNAKPTGTFQTLCKEAGLAKDLTMKALLDTPGAWLMGIGSNKKRWERLELEKRADAVFVRSPGYLRHIAFFLGKTINNLKRRYKISAPENQKKAADVMEAAIVRSA